MYLFLSFSDQAVKKRQSAKKVVTFSSQLEEKKEFYAPLALDPMSLDDVSCHAHIDSLIDWWFIWVTHWWMDYVWLIDWFIEIDWWLIWVIHWLIGGLFQWLIDWLMDYLSDSVVSELLCCMACMAWWWQIGK